MEETRYYANAKQGQKLCCPYDLDLGLPGTLPVLSL
jgi:hypothetical protein